MKTSIVITKTGNRNPYRHISVPVNEVHSRTFHQSSKTYDRDTMRFLEMFGPGKKGDKDCHESDVKVSVDIRHWEDQIQIPFEASLGF